MGQTAAGQVSLRVPMVACGDHTSMIVRCGGINLEDLEVKKFTGAMRVADINIMARWQVTAIRKTTRVCHVPRFSSR